MITLEDKQWLSTDEVLDLLPISREVLYSLRKNNTGPRSFRMGRRFYYPKDALVEWMNSLGDDDV